MNFIGAGRDKIPMSTGNTRENGTGNKNGGSRTRQRTPACSHEGKAGSGNNLLFKINLKPVIQLNN